MAIKALEAAIERFGMPLFVYHEIVHNNRIVELFRSRGVQFVDAIDDVPLGARVLFSAHGVSPEIRITAIERNIETIDATCPLVRKVHQDVIRYASSGYTVVLIGHRGHDEVIGVMCEAPEYIRIVENEREILELPFGPNEKLAYLTQTTFSMDETRRMIDLLKRRYPGITGPANANICYATQNRQNAVKELSVDADIVLVIGSHSSSNSRRLAEKAESLGVCSYLVDGPDDIATGWFQGEENVLITAGASAPEHVVQGCVQMLKARFGATVEEKTVCQETVSFPLPAELR